MTRFSPAAASLLSLVAVGCGGGTSATNTPSATPTSTPTASGATSIGDTCLVGRWSVTTYEAVNSTTVPGVSIPTAGLAGLVFTFGGDGSESDDYSQSSPLSGSASGHTLTYTFRGTVHFRMHAAAGMWAESGAAQPITVTNFVVDGMPHADFSGQSEPARGTYTCSANTLELALESPVVAVIHLNRG